MNEGENMGYEMVKIETTIVGKKYIMSFDREPQRVLTLSQYATEMFLALGLEDKIVGTSYMEDDIHPKFEEQYERLNVMATVYPTKEEVLKAKPDLVTGRGSAFIEKYNLMSPDELLEKGINSFVSNGFTPDGDLETVFNDFMALGKVFNVEERAEKVVADMKKSITDTTEQLGDIKDKKRVVLYDSGTETPYVIGGGAVQGDIIRKAMIDNPYDNIKKGYVPTTWEEIAGYNPKLIVIVNLEDEVHKTGAQEKITMIKNNQEMKDVIAVKEDNFAVINLIDLAPGIRNVEAIEKLAKAAYPEKF